MNCKSFELNSKETRESHLWRNNSQNNLTKEDVIVKSSTVGEEKNTKVIHFLELALETCGIENEIATFIKRNCDEAFGMNWQVIVGRNFGSHLDCIEYIHLTISKISVLIFRCM